VVENAAIAAARTMGFGDRHKADEVAVEAMRKTMDSLQMDGIIVIGEGERDEAPMLYIGEKVGLATHAPNANFPAVDIAVDPLEGTNLCATGAANAIAVLAASERGGLLHAPDLYMEKIVVGPSCKGAVDLDAPVSDNLKSIAKRLDRDVEDLVIIVLDRPRHEKLIEAIRKAGARIRLIGDGDLSAGISAAVVGTGVHAVMGTGGAPEGVLTAAALRCLNGQILGRLVLSKPQDAERLEKMGVKDPKRIYDTTDLAPGKKMIFACTGVTDGNLLRGVRFFGEGVPGNGARLESGIAPESDPQSNYSPPQGEPKSGCCGGSRRGHSSAAPGFDAPSRTGRRLRGVIYDESRGVVPQATVSVLNLDTKMTQTRSSDAVGAYSFPTLTPGRYKLTVGHPGFAMFTNAELAVPATLDVVLSVGKIMEGMVISGRRPLQAVTPTNPIPQRIRVGGNVQAARLLDHPRPSYPARAEAAAIEGRVLLQAVIRKDGGIMGLVIQSSPDPELADAAVQAVQQWRYQPTLLNGQPVEVVTTISVDFRLDR